MGACLSSAVPDPPPATSFYHLHALDIDKHDLAFTELNDKDFRLLEGEYASRGLVIMAFPCNQVQFMKQEPGSNEAIKMFMRSRRFRGLLMDKVDVNGRHTSPVWAWLKHVTKFLKPVPWNYTKFLVGRDGKVYGPYLPHTRPAQLEPSIRRLLAEGQVAPVDGTSASDGAGAGGGAAVPEAVRAGERGTVAGEILYGLGIEVKALFKLRPQDGDGGSGSGSGAPQKGGPPPSQQAAAAAAAGEPPPGGQLPVLEQALAEPHEGPGPC